MTRDIDWKAVSDVLANSAEELVEECKEAKKDGDPKSANAFAVTASVCAHLAVAIAKGINAAKDSSHEGALQ